MVSSRAFELIAYSCCGVAVGGFGATFVIATSLNLESCMFHIFRERFFACELDACDLEDRKKTRPKDMDQVKENNSSLTDS